MTFESEDNVSEDQTQAEETPAEAPVAAEPPAEPEEQLSPKERRKRERATQPAAASQRSTEERAQERAERRAGKARDRRIYRERQRARHAAAPRGETPAVAERPPAVTKIRQGVVVSDKADKTISVRIDTASRHRMYKKIVRSSTTLHAHDERNDAHEGDTVRIVESRPLSRTKRWRLVEVVERAR